MEVGAGHSVAVGDRAIPLYTRSAGFLGRDLVAAAFVVQRVAETRARDGSGSVRRVGAAAGRRHDPYKRRLRTGCRCAGCCMVCVLRQSGCASCGLDLGCSGGGLWPTLGLGFGTGRAECAGMSGTDCRSRYPGCTRSPGPNATVQSARGRRATSLRTGRGHARMSAASTASLPCASG